MLEKVKIAHDTIIAECALSWFGHEVWRDEKHITKNALDAFLVVSGVSLVYWDR